MRTAQLVAAWLLLGTCTADAERPEIQEIPLAFVLSGVCVDQEDIAITGTEYMQFRQSFDAQGGLHLSYRFGFRGNATGVGLSSGIRYRLVGSSGGSEFYSSSLPVAISRQVRFSFVGAGPGNNVQAFETTNIKINADGQMTVSITDVSFECPD